jgi:hypothetical protein
MDSKVSALERAFQLARSGQAAFADIEKQLDREGYDRNVVRGRTPAEGAIEKADPRGQGAKGRPESHRNALIVWRPNFFPVLVLRRLSRRSALRGRHSWLVARKSVAGGGMIPTSGKVSLCAPLAVVVRVIESAPIGLSNKKSPLQRVIPKGEVYRAGDTGDARIQNKSRPQTARVHTGRGRGGSTRRERTPRSRASLRTLAMGIHHSPRGPDLAV